MENGGQAVVRRRAELLEQSPESGSVVLFTDVGNHEQNQYPQSLEQVTAEQVFAGRSA